MLIHVVSQLIKIKSKYYYKHTHTAIMVGALHGTAGSAPLLALVPFTSYTSPWGGIAYLIVFGLGLLVSMLIFGIIVGMIFSRAIQQGKAVINFIRSWVALASIVFGVFLLNDAF